MKFIASFIWKNSENRSVFDHVVTKRECDCFCDSRCIQCIINIHYPMRPVGDYRRQLVKSPTAWRRTSTKGNATPLKYLSPGCSLCHPDCRRLLQLLPVTSELMFLPRFRFRSSRGGWRLWRGFREEPPSRRRRRCDPRADNDSKGIHCVYSTMMMMMTNRK